MDKMEALIGAVEHERAAHPDWPPTYDLPPEFPTESDWPGRR